MELCAPDLLGASGRRTYLILAQNNYELRPTGGFISGVGVLEVEDGRIVSFPFKIATQLTLAGAAGCSPADFQQTLYGQLCCFKTATGMWILRIGPADGGVCP
jgi:hypothetical protein